MVQILGVRRVQYMSRKTGNPVSGYTLFVSEDDVPEVVGVQTDNVFLSDANAAPFVSQFKALPDMLGLKIEVAYNKFGSATGVKLAE